MSTVAMLVGGILGVLLRNLLEGPRTADVPPRWRSVVISVLGGPVLGALTGVAVGGLHGDGPAAVLGVGLSGLLLTYCLFSSAATELRRSRCRGGAGRSSGADPHIRRGSCTSPPDSV